MKNTQIQNLKSGAHIHLMGVCGTAMASLAGLLKDRGFKVSGSELNPYPPMSTQIEELGIKIMKPYSAKNLSPKPDFVIVGNVISASNEEAKELLRLEIPYTSLPKAMGELIIADKESVVIAGTHGKTTTTSLMAWIATELNLEPGFLIGGIPKNFSRSFQNPKGKYFIIEGDEYDTAFFDKVPKFIHYKPKHVILTSIEFDHADIYKDLDDVKSAFARLIELTPKDGTFIYCGDDKNVSELSKKSKIKKQFSYGIYKKSNTDYQAQILETSEEGTRFNIYFKNDRLGEFKTILSGEYNILNCTAVIALCHQQNFDLEKVKSAIQTFQGVKRRQEILGEPKGILIIEDFAHHPTAVRETLKGIKDKYKNRKVFAVFEPRSATSRRKIFQKEYVEAFQMADEILIMQAFDQAKIEQSNRFSTEELVHDIEKKGLVAHSFDSVDAIISNLVQYARPHDVVIIMSNGGFDGIYGKLMKALSP